MIHQNVDADTAEALKVLIERIKASKVPSSMLDESILVASWNIRDFGKGKRTPKAIHCIAEVLSWFDLVSIQELGGDLHDLGKVMEVLGPYWKVVFSDVTEGAHGNKERIGYLFDKRAVNFTGLAAEAVVPPATQKSDGKKTEVPAAQFWRTPYIASFRAGTFDFVLLTVHVQWGKPADRLVELERIADWVEARRKSPFVEDKDIILMGDTNIPAFGDKFYNAITKNGLASPKEVLGVPGGTNIPKRNARYDQIFYYPQATGSVFTGVGGAVDFYANDHKPLFPDLSLEKFTYQLSDHLPLWLQVKTDTTDEELDQIIRAGN